MYLDGEGVFVIPGTTSVSYAWQNWPHALAPLSSPAGQLALEAFTRNRSHVTRVVGHSFGALIADSIAQRYHVQGTGYNSPLPLHAIQAVTGWDLVGSGTAFQSIAQGNFEYSRFGHGV